MKQKINNKVRISSGGEATVLGELGTGGQGIVYRVSYYDKEYALKWYHKPGKPEFYSNLKQNIEKGSPASQFLWPLFLTETDKDGCYGYLMELRDPAYKEFSDFLLAKVQFASVEAMVEAGVNICIGFRRLHNLGYSYQDLNDGNFFINPQNGDVLICDNDNVAPHGVNTGILGKCRYMAPEVVTRKSEPNAQSDRFSLGIILFMLLFGNHPLEGEKIANIACMTEKNERILYGSKPTFIYDPHDATNRPVRGIHDNVLSLWPQYPSFVHDIFVTQFGKEVLKNPSLRITEKEWLHRLLIPLRHDLIRCPSCKHEIFAHITDQPIVTCDDCGFVMRRPPLIQSGNFRVATCAGKKIFSYITDSHSTDALECTAVVVESAKTPGLLGLRNQTSSQWLLTTRKGNCYKIEPQKTAPMLVGNIISCNNGTTIKII